MATTTSAGVERGRPSMPMKVSVCVPTIRFDTVADTIASIRNQRYPNWELLVIGQGAEDGIRPVVEHAAGGDARVRYVHLKRRGLSIARNHALDIATGDVVAFTDDDCEAPEDWLDQVVTAFERYPHVGLVFGSLNKPEPQPSRFRVCPEFAAEELIYDPIATNRQAPAAFGACGANFSVRRDAARRIGYFDEHLGAGARFPAAEETDYVLRGEMLGIAMYCTPNLVIQHTHGYRYGFKAVYAHRRAYARGNGALAAKHTLLGDDRGRRWLRSEVSAATIEPIRRFKPHILPARLLRLAYFVTAYRACTSEYGCNPGTGLDGLVRATLQKNSELESSDQA